MPEDILLVEKAAEGYAVVTLNRPEARNAWSIALCRRFSHACAELQADPSVRVVILTGSGRSFSAGLDVKEMRADPAGFFAHLRHSDPARALAALSKPRIGAINGDAITGGFELALICDVLYASDTARFVDTHTRIGLMPGWGISQRLSRRVGIGKAKEISLSARPVSAIEAAAIGLVERVCEPQRLQDDARQLARDMIAGDAGILAAYRQLIDDGYAMNLGDALALENERRLASKQQPLPASASKVAR